MNAGSKSNILLSKGQSTYTRKSGSSSSACALAIVGFVCALSATISVASPFVVQHASAATWPVPTSRLSASMEFHQTYSAGGLSYVHSGIDIPASAGTQISNPLAGTVRFTGDVPSGDLRRGGVSQNKTMQAVSVELKNGRVITLMPFETIDVEVGERVDEGVRLGTLAQSGDPSSSGSHLHLGYKQGKRYFDPMLLFGAQASSPHSQVGQEQEGLEAPMSASETPVVDPVATQLPEEGAEELGDAYLSPAPAAEPETFGVIETGQVEWVPRKEQGFSPFAPVLEAFGTLAAACYGQFSDFAEALRELSRGTGIPLEMITVALFAAGLFAMAGLAVLCMRFGAPFVREVWRNKKQRLCERKGGDSMHKLFPASGAAFMSRSR